MNQESTYLGIENVVVRYGQTEVLRDISLSVKRGSFVALLGSSGCGKTTLLRAISGFTLPSAGRILLAGRDITFAPPEKRNTAMVFQSYALWPHMTVYQNMAYGLKLRRRPRSEIDAKIDKLLALLHLEGLKDRNTTQLSGGQRQRVALGRALAIDPDVLLLDEPLSNLDARIRVELRSEIRAIQSRLGITAIHVTHDREEAMVLADHIIVLRDGQIEQAGTPEAVYHRPASPFVASFMGADNVVRLKIRKFTDSKIEVAYENGTASTRASLPVGNGGAQVEKIVKGGEIDAYFRAVSARLAPSGEKLARGRLSLPGTIEQASYPGDVWRYWVRSGTKRFVIDDTRRLQSGDMVNIVLPADALHLFPRNAG